MRIKEIYTEREKEDVQTVDCMMCGECIHKCPEDHALSMTFCGKKIYSSSRQSFLSKYAPKNRKGKKEDAKTAKREGDVMEQKNERSDNVLSEKQKELYIKKSTRIVASYLRRFWNCQIHRRR